MNQDLQSANGQAPALELPQEDLAPLGEAPGADNIISDTDPNH